MKNLTVSIKDDERVNDGKRENSREENSIPHIPTILTITHIFFHIPK